MFLRTAFACLLLVAAGRSAAADPFAEALGWLLDEAVSGEFVEEAASAALVQDLAPARMAWERLDLRRRPLALEGDTLWQVLLEGRGRLACDGGVAKVRRALLLASPLPADLAALDWRPLRQGGPLAAFGDMARRKALAELDWIDPGNPVLDWAAAPDRGQPFLWIEFDEDGLRHEAAGEPPAIRWTRELHGGSRLDWPLVAGDPDGARAPAPSFGRLTLLATADVWLRTGWELRLEARCGGARLLWLQLDPVAALDSLWRVDGDGARRDLPALRGGGRALGSEPPWVAVPLEAGVDSLLLEARGSAPDRLLREESAARSGIPGWAWFPRPAALPSSQRLHVESPVGWVWWSPSGPLLRRVDGERASAAQRIDLPRPVGLVPLAAARLESEPPPALAWSSSTRLARRAEPRSARRTGFFDYGEDLLAKERDFLPPDPTWQADEEYDSSDPNRPAAAPPGRDDGTGEALAARRWRAEDGRSELVAGAAALERLLGPPPAPLLLVESRGEERGRDAEAGRLLRGPGPRDWPEQLEDRRLRGGAPHDRLARIEALARQWWPADGPLGQADRPGLPAARWLRRGLARACALLALEDLGAVDDAADLRREALARELERFHPGPGEAFVDRLLASDQPGVSPGSLGAGERADGEWRSEAVLDRLAWRFALLLEHLRWRLRDPATLDDGSWRAFLRILASTAPEAGEATGGEAFFADYAEAWLDASGLRERAHFARDDGGFAAWFDRERSRDDVPVLELELGSAPLEGRERLLLECRSAAGGDPLVLPVWLRFGEVSSLQLLVIRGGSERFPMDGDPAALTGWQAAPLSSLIARIR